MFSFRSHLLPTLVARFEFASGPFHLNASMNPRLALAKVEFRTPYQLKEENIPKGGWSDVALCSGLAALADNHFDRCTLFRCGVIFYAINAPALISIRTITARRSASRPLSMLSGSVLLVSLTSQRTQGARQKKGESYGYIRRA